MTEKQAQKIRSLAANGVPYVHIHDKETNELMDIVQDITERNVEKEAILSESQSIRYVPVFDCPNCRNTFTGTVSKFCYRCGQALSYKDYMKKKGEET